MEIKKMEADVQTLVQMLRYRRQANTRTEAKFINRFIIPLGCKRDNYGNYYISIGAKPRILWSAHTDSVHRMQGKQKIVLSGDYIKLGKGERSNCLGADNAAGVWILREMIIANVPGLYVFHRDEESGGKGSAWFAENMKHMLEGIEAAIAFDRRGTKSIITHQYYGMTASDRFAVHLAELIGMNHRPDDGGTFTDTASYADIISECSNISVGFNSEHSSSETLDLKYAVELRDAMVNIDPDDIACFREPGDYGDNYSSWFSGGGYGIHDDKYEKSLLPSKSKGRSTFSGVLDGSEYMRLIDLCKRYPDSVADFLEMNGIGPYEIEDHIYQSMGYSTYAEDKDSG